MNTGPQAPDEPPTLVALLRAHAQRQPDRRVYTFLIDGETDEVHLTYRELDRRARAIGALLQGMGGSGERALLVYPPGLDYITAFFGCLYAGVVAVPVYPPDPARPERSLPRFRSIVQDAHPRVVLTLTPVLAMAEALLAHHPDLKAMGWVATDKLAPTLAEQWQAPALDGDTLAFLQYTSGSTAAPKGVMLSHSNLLHNSSLIQRFFENSPDTRGMLWLPPYHDMGLVGAILQPFYAGFPMVLMSPFDFLQHPVRWLQAITRYRVTLSGGPNFAYDLCVRKITPQQRETLDLSSWRLAFNGAEPVRAETLDRFATTFGPCGFSPQALYPCYGLAEASLIVSGGLKMTRPVLATVQSAALERHRVVRASDQAQDARTLVSAGRTRPDQTVIIVDPETCLQCPPDHIGEIWIASASVARGYWNKPQETERTFRACLADSGQGPFLRTGDLGFMQDGELFITGRIKDMIIIDGRNLYPHDIELSVEKSHPALRPGGCAAFSVEAAGKEQLIVVAEIDRRYQPGAQPDPEAIYKAIRRSVSQEHEARVYEIVLIKAGSMPKTSSGKVQRHACRAGYLAGSLESWGK